MKQKQCNDTYDVCIKGCPARSSGTPAKPEALPVAERLKSLDELLKAGAITREEYESKRKDILGSI